MSSTISALPPATIVNPADLTVMVQGGANMRATAQQIADLTSPLFGYIGGYTLSAAANVLSASPGNCTDSTGAVLIRNTPSTYTGAFTASATFHVFIARKDSDLTTKLIVNASATNPASTLPAGYTYFRRLGSVLTDAGSNVLPFFQMADRFYLLTPWLSATHLNPGVAAFVSTLMVPTGLRLLGMLNIGLPGAAVNVYLSSPDCADLAPSVAIAPLSTTRSNAAFANFFGVIYVQTNTTRQIRGRFSASGGGESMTVVTLGWEDNRGKDGSP